MTSGHWFSCVVALSLALGIATAERMHARDAAGWTVDLLLTTAPALPAQAKAALVAEATSIWRREGVSLRFPPPAAVPPEDAPRLRVLVIHREVEGDGHWPVGELLRTGADGTIPAPPGYAVAVISIPAARRVVAAAGFGRDVPTVADRRLGVVLGRAVAHELGHYLLATTTHAPHGLMRARIDAADFSDLRAGAFFLDRDARHWMQRAAGAFTSAARFSYREH
jgi:hypothetical protein